jgi:hypothetical protein
LQRSALELSLPQPSDLPVLPSFVALSIVATLLFVVYWPRRHRTASPQERQSSAKAGKFDTTLGDFHDMREALRPLANMRVASRREPQGR